ncbi:cation:proton antiporter [Streptosporangium sp. NPDC003464]
MTVLDVVAHFFLGVVVVLSCAHLAGSLAQRLGQPRVVGEICAGLALGPSLLGNLSPELADLLLPRDILPMIDGLSQLGLVLFVFGVGQELASTRLRGTARQGLLISQASMAVPFVAGVLVAVPLIGGTAEHPVASVLFIGCALSITAFPVLARLLSDLGIGRTRPGQLSLLAAAVGDGASWLLLAVALAVAGGSGPGGLLVSAVGAVVVTIAFLGPVRLALARWADRAGPASPISGGLLPVVAVAATATLTAVIGIHQLIGALLVGIAWPAHRQGAAALMETSKSVLLPFFFLSFGLGVDLGSLQLDGATMGALAALLTAAVGAKIAGPGLCGRLTGLSWRDSFILGSLLNTRGLTELVVIQVGYQAGLIDQRLLAILTVVALATTVMTAPLLRLAGLRPPGARTRRAAAGPAPPPAGTSAPAPPAPAETPLPAPPVPAEMSVPALRN